MTKDHLINLIRKVFLLTALLGFVMSSCNSQSDDVPQLRITNNGSIPINNLVVMFPEDRVEFGNIPTGATTEYKDVPKGVFSYAAYQFEVNGEVITQPVIDWVGENPMSGILFTYTVDFDPNRASQGDRVQLLKVKNDD